MVWPSGGFKSSQLELWEAFQFLCTVCCTGCEAADKICGSISSNLLVSMN